MEIVSYSYNGVQRLVDTKGANGKVGGIAVTDGQATVKRRGRRLQGDGQRPLCELIIHYWEQHPDAKPREIARALGISDGKGSYVSQVLYRYRHQAEQKRLVASSVAPIPDHGTIQEGFADSELAQNGNQPDRGEVASSVASIHGTIQEGFTDSEPAQNGHKPDRNEEYSIICSLLGRLMLMLIRKGFFDPVLVRRWIFDAVGIRNEDEYRLFAELVADPASWLYKDMPSSHL
jgi:hypothetical protein